MAHAVVADGLDLALVAEPRRRLAGGDVDRDELVADARENPRMGDLVTGPVA